MLSPKKVGILAVVLVGAVTILSLSSQIFETNSKGYYQIKQAAVSGEMTVINEPGMYTQLFGDIHTYKISDTFFFDGREGQPISVRFQDGGTADVYGSLKYRLSTKPSVQLKLHEDFRSDEAVKMNLVAPIVQEALKQSAPHMTAEDSYSAKRAEFTSLVEDQVTIGIFETVSNKVMKTDPQGNKFIETYLEIKVDGNGQPAIKKLSTLKNYNIEIIRFVITDIDYDDTIDKLIALKKEAEQQKVVARANAEKSKQDAITAREEGNARIAKAKADEEVAKIKEVTQAEKKYEVSVLNRKQAAEDAKARLIKQKAEADANALLVKAGLTPLEKATIEKETAIGVARELSKIQLPSTFIAGGGGKSGGALDPFTAIGLEAFMNINEKLATPKNQDK
ncbi:MAG: SPFH domain-containing protein [Flavobacteriaceae bacterium]|nr:SPFH domain-containing protein [Flavobacteriaceae bacterium]